MNHEFRSGLTGIAAFSHLIRDTDLSAGAIRAIAGDIHADAQRLARIYDDLTVTEKSLESLG